MGIEQLHGDGDRVSKSDIRIDPSKTLKWMEEATVNGRKMVKDGKRKWEKMVSVHFLLAGSPGRRACATTTVVRRFPLVGVVGSNSVRV
jgi:hypothetical protein